MVLDDTILAFDDLLKELLFTTSRQIEVLKNWITPQIYNAFFVKKE